MRENKVEIKRPNLPLDPIVGEADSEYPEIKAAHNALLAEFKRLDEICSSQVEGVSWGCDKEKRLYSVKEYNEMLAAYRAARKAYVGRYRKKLETIDMVREKIRKLQEEEERFAAANGCNEIEEPPDLPDFEEVPNEPWENFIKRQKEYMDRLQEVANKSLESMQKQCEQNRFFVRRLEEILDSFPQSNEDAVDVFFNFAKEMDYSLPDKDFTIKDVFDGKLKGSGFDTLNISYRGIKYKNDPWGAFINTKPTLCLKNSIAGIVFPIENNYELIMTHLPANLHLPL